MELDRTFGRIRRRWEDGIKLELEKPNEIDYCGLDLSVDMVITKFQTVCSIYLSLPTFAIGQLLSR
jgi:hypothetical protein